MTIQCCVCKKILCNAGPAAPISHTVGPCCWFAYRASLGLSVKPYPTNEVQ